MAAKKTFVHCKILTSVPKQDFSEIWNAAYNENHLRDISFHVRTPAGRVVYVLFKLVAIEYADGFGNSITFKGVDSRRGRYKGSCDFTDHSKDWVNIPSTC